MGRAAGCLRDSDLACNSLDREEDDVFLQPEWEIDPHDIYFCSRSNGKLCRLGKGAFGTVRPLSSKMRILQAGVCPDFPVS